jgi:hypothetical protein
MSANMSTTENNSYFRPWPFPVSDEDKQSPEEAQKIEFLESIYSDGFEVYRVRREKEQERYGAQFHPYLGSVMQWGSKKGKESVRSLEYFLMVIKDSQLL